MSQENQRVVRLRGFFAKDPTNVALACDLLDAQLVDGDIEGADAVLADLPAALRTQPGIRFRRARGHLIGGRYGDAAGELRDLIDEGHANAALWHDLAFAQLCERDFVRASATIADARERFGDSAELAVVAARVALIEQDFPRAQIELDEALSQVPQHPTALGLRALALFDEGQLDAAREAAAATLTINPDQHEALLVAATAALWAQDQPLAQTHFDRALSRHPNSGRALSGLGQLHMVRNDLEGAIPVLRRALVAMPDHVGTWHALAWAHLLRGEIDAAQAGYERAYDLDRNFAESHGGLALVHALRARHEEAESAIKRALRLDPKCLTALYARSLLMAERGEQAEAERLFAGVAAPMGLPAGTDLRAFAAALRSRLDGAR